MSIGLAIQKIGEYTAKYDLYSSYVRDIQGLLEIEGLQAIAQGGQVNQHTQENLRKKLAVYMYLQGLYKDFVEYWKQVIQSIHAVIKSIQELAQGAR